MSLNEISSSCESPVENGLFYKIHTILLEIKSQQDELKQEIGLIREVLTDTCFQQKELKSELSSTRRAVTDIILHVQEICEDINERKSKERNKDSNVSIFKSYMLKARRLSETSAKEKLPTSKRRIVELPMPNKKLLLDKDNETDSSDTEIMEIQNNINNFDVESNDFSDSEPSFVDNNNKSKPEKKNLKSQTKIKVTPQKNKNQSQEKKLHNSKKKEEFKVPLPPKSQTFKSRAPTKELITSTPYKRELGRLSTSMLKFTMPSPVPNENTEDLNLTTTRSGRVSKPPIPRFAIRNVILDNYSKNTSRQSISVSPKIDNRSSNVEKNSVVQRTVRRLYSPTVWSESRELKELEKSIASM